MRKFYAEIEKLDDNEIKIIGHDWYGDSYGYHQIIIYKDDIPWIIETLKAKTKKDYYEEWCKTTDSHSEYQLGINTIINRGDTSHMDISPLWNQNRDDSSVISIPYSDYNDLMESITPFISLLEDFVKKSS